MYIEPNSNIKIYHNVPLDNTYNHTIYFDSLSDQNSYFHGSSGIVKYNLTNQSYQRVVKGSMRVAVKADNLYDCNYLAFRNISFGSKWFYAFITSVEYVNNETSEITFEIDVMQTYFFDVELKECFVEREHSGTDKIGENIQPEPVKLGEYINSDYGTIASDDGDMLVIIMIAESASVAGNLYDGIYSGAQLWAYNSTDTTAITGKLNAYVQSPDSVIAVYMCPKTLIPNVPEGGKSLPYSATSSRETVQLQSVTDGTLDFGGYVPKNKKLYTYPYNFLCVSNNNGQSLTLRYEFFDDLTPVIEVSGTFQQPVKLVARPCNYKGYPSKSSASDYVSSKTEALTLDNYPMCSWNVDTFKAWVAQNSIPIAINSLGALAGASAIEQYSEKGSTDFGSSSISAITNALSSAYTASIQADQCRGNIASGNVNVSRGTQRFYRTRCHITFDYAKTIDQFFSMFGYTTNRVKVPSRRSRPHWHYLKTAGCVLVGNAPADDVRKLCNIYDNGITFWRKASEVGNYSLDNSPIGE